MPEMKNPHGSMRRRTAIASATLLISLAVPAVVHADWIPSTQDARCDPEDIDGVTASIRDAIEASVRRAEASISAPMAIGDLSCLNDLMNAPLDIFSNIGGLLGTLQGGLLSALPFPMDMDVSGMLCGFAAEKWGELTNGLSGLDVSLDDFALTPASMSERLANGGGWGGGGSNIPGFNGTINTGDGNTPTGTDFTPIGVSPDVESRPLYPTVPDSIPDGFIFDEAAFNAAAAAYETSVATSMSGYIACRTAQILQGQGGHGNGDYGQGGGFGGTCPQPSGGTPPDVNDYIVEIATAPAPQVPDTHYTGNQVVQYTAPSELIPAPAPAETTPTGTFGSGGGNNASTVWENM